MTLSSETHRLIAKLDLVEADGDSATPVDYKRGSPRKTADGELEAWDADRAQLAVQALVLREHGYRCDEAILYFVATKQCVRVAIDDALVSQTLAWLAEARRVAEEGVIPPPLVDSPKCRRQSLATQVRSHSASEALSGDRESNQRRGDDHGHNPHAVHWLPAS